MRGKDPAERQRSGKPGITPAYAGKSTSAPDFLGGKQDHPRVCGEKRKAGKKGDYRGGSPPRMRGKVPARRPVPGGHRITPAYAGKSQTGDPKVGGN